MSALEPNDPVVLLIVFMLAFLIGVTVFKR